MGEPFAMGPVTVTCHTDGCGNAEIPLLINAVVTGPDGQPITPGVTCGVCGQPITDIVPA